MTDYTKPVKKKMIAIRVSDVDIAKIKENARRRGMSMSRFVRYRCLFDGN